MTTSTTLERALFVPRELVFDAWTVPEQVTAWYPPEAGAAPSARVEARPGGIFEVHWTDAEGRRVAVSGRVVSLQPSSSLRLSLAEPGAAAPSGVRLELLDQDGAGAIRLTLDCGKASADAASALWRARLERLERFFSVI